MNVNLHSLRDLTNIFSLETIKHTEATTVFTKNFKSLKIKDKNKISFKFIDQLSTEKFLKIIFPLLKRVV